MSKKVKISKLVLDIEGKKIELTIKQAHALQDVLNETFGEDTVVVHEHYDRYPWQYPNTWYNTNDVTCRGNETGTISNFKGEQLTSSVLNITLDDLRGAQISLT